MATTMATVTPNNALLLTRCRSAPYRSSSLACQFWGLTETEENAQKTEEERNRVSGTENRDSTSKSRGDQDSKQISINNYNINNNIVSDYDDLESCAEVEVNDKKIEEFEEDKNGDFEKPLMMLRRSKSESVRRDLEKIDPQISEFWRLRRLGNTQSSTPESHALHS